MYWILTLLAIVCSVLVVKAVKRRRLTSYLVGVEDRLRMAAAVVEIGEDETQPLPAVSSESFAPDVEVLKLDRLGNVIAGTVVHRAEFVRMDGSDRAVLRKSNGALVRRSARRLQFIV
ncbi:MAG: hypothetical protein UY02_C0007G0026 [Candidatus Giovannonibacteria bacterium GW2011_GWB1_47_6b]|uniref:Uncharacterized protein n=1 Tax=Candidatus Giovannonibacteria bacterium GW2011_GWB1_47_6b TaxID=1618655 RepID=A0A0G1W462_9BACT|nr:MAG: hypothetical protein UY02_C0007G0026 [Candidatus Giovannonibacteria bacterium GW2011_GWB1_47_6b]